MNMKDKHCHVGILHYRINGNDFLIKEVFVNFYVESIQYIVKDIFIGSRNHFSHLAPSKSTDTRVCVILLQIFH